MGREIKRVALDFDWPIDMLWKGYVCPYSAQLCEACDGSGYNAETKAIADDFYDVSRTGRRWCDRITQDEVDALVREGRLRCFVGGKWQEADPPPTANEVNVCQAAGLLGSLRGHRFDAHDEVNRWILIETRAKRLGVNGPCKHCDGTGEIWASPEVKALHDAWTPVAPPAGVGYQLWSTTTEGHPMSPVFADPQALARWLVDNKASSFGSATCSYEQWLAFITGPGWAPSLLVDANGLHSGVAEISTQASTGEDEHG